MMKGRLVSLLVACLVMAPAQAAWAGTESQAVGPVQATLTYDSGTESRQATNVRLTVARAGAVTLMAALAGGSCVEPYCFPGAFGEPALTVADLDMDGEPEVRVDLFTGGAHCCVVTRFFRWDGTRYLGFSRNFADFGYTSQDLDGDGTVELVSGDARFAYAFASFASSLFPVQVFDLVDGRLADTTGRHLGLVRTDAGRAWRQYLTASRHRGEPRGPIAAWAADRYRLGQRQSTLRTLRGLAHQRRLRPGTSANQRRFVAHLDRFLLVRGYGR